MRYSIRDIETAVAARYRLTRDDIRGIGRARAVARPRQIAMYLAREMTGQSLPRIGAHFGRHHTTVLCAMRRIHRLMAEDERFKAQVEGCRELITRVGPLASSRNGEKRRSTAGAVSASVVPRVAGARARDETSGNVP
jgi:hypothetical protein